MNIFKYFHRCNFSKPIISKYNTFSSRKIIYECKCGKRKEFKVWREYGDAFPIPTSNLITNDEYKSYLNSKPMINQNLIELETLLQSQNLEFRELDTRMSYGMIGHLFNKNGLFILIFPKSFYTRQNKANINQPLLRIIELIRVEFKNVSRDNNNRISPVVLGECK